MRGLIAFLRNTSDGLVAIAFAFRPIFTTLWRDGRINRSPTLSEVQLFKGFVVRTSDYRSPRSSACIEDVRRCRTLEAAGFDRTFDWNQCKRNSLGNFDYVRGTPAAGGDGTPVAKRETGTRRVDKGKSGQAQRLR